MSSQKIHQTLHLGFMYKELAIHCLKGKRVKQFDFCQLMWSGENICSGYLDIFALVGLLIHRSIHSFSGAAGVGGGDSSDIYSVQNAKCWGGYR